MFSGPPIKSAKDITDLAHALESGFAAAPQGASWPRDLSSPPAGDKAHEDFKSSLDKITQHEAKRMSSPSKNETAQSQTSGQSGETKTTEAAEETKPASKSNPQGKEGESTETNGAKTAAKPSGTTETVMPTQASPSPAFSTTPKAPLDATQSTSTPTAQVTVTDPKVIQTSKPTETPPPAIPSNPLPEKAPESKEGLAENLAKETKTTSKESANPELQSILRSLTRAANSETSQETGKAGHGQSDAAPTSAGDKETGPLRTGLPQAAERSLENRMAAATRQANAPGQVAKENRPEPLGLQKKAQIVVPTPGIHVSGTNGAKNTHSMDRSEQMRQETRPGLQSLPGRSGSLPSQAGGPAARQDTSFSSTPQRSEHSPLSDLIKEDIVPQEMAQSKPGAARSVTALRSVAGEMVHTIEQIQLRVSAHAMEIRGSRAESMSVVIRPDGQTEMVLSLKMQNGMVDVEARMQRGDFSSINSGWNQLQQSLSQQGIRVSPLQSSDLATTDQESNRHFDQSLQQQDRQTPNEQDARESALQPSSRQAGSGQGSQTTTSRNTPSDSSPTLTRGGHWESWA